uniref:indole-3-glycerol-phosphate synthase n=1 Tax=Pyramimonas obovata TaxID=1411642 RepID=A0A7S0R661_9CHLO|mmetsp:Transcript_26601/g.57884  ORF Transcript_26601/g.57884 Transcript_26601/m.57884 type:complete len:353 (+) Transcript_26601:92-1150(+)|eukprot:CAMPEP_0118932942 /NCGR_PEP_ID=MMETSP1169-20130426/10755_1 /TAXON_ID=36882 /ORGANISM="Pyramimonas obovata, Strain CCMP722" /LENGTH=352 /DNA_ID=CAMNT_0006875651 /DNA_START=91 /DNA_END=1149 /DNA_ORIENTATION=-
MASSLCSLHAPIARTNRQRADFKQAKLRAQPARSHAMRVSASSSAAEPTEVVIRRRPPSGVGSHSCGPDFDFKVEGADEPINILEEIVWSKNPELDRRKEKLPLPLLMNMVKAAAPARDFLGALLDFYERTGKPGLISEVKKASPSKGVIQPDFDPVRIATEYEKGGASCLSVLTDEKYFQGSFENLKAIRRAGVECPLLCKEFIIEPYQIYLARAMGADAILLIAAVLPNQDLTYLMKIAHSLGMTVLVEVHTHKEMERVLELEDLKLLGINNRDLGTFEVSLDVTVDLMAGPLGDIVRERGITMVGESGIFTPDDVKVVQDAGVKAILVGESLVRENDPATAIRTLLSLD